MLPPMRRALSLLLQKNRAKASATTKSNLESASRASGGLREFTFGGSFFAIEDMVCGAEEFSDGLAVAGIDGYSGAHGDGWLVAIVSEPLGNAIGKPQGGRGVRFGK